MNDSQPISPRARLQALQAIPERQRTDAEWDELNELEIMLASTNRQGGPEPQGSRGNVPSQGGHPRQGGQQSRPGGQQQPRPGGGQQHHGKRQGKRFHQRPPKRNGP